jgi:hypothetical protein
VAQTCKACKGEITIAIFKGGDWCCDDCRKKVQAPVNHIRWLSNNVPLCVYPTNEDFVIVDYGPGMSCENCSKLLGIMNTTSMNEEMTHANGHDLRA